MRLRVAYSKIKKRNLVLINNDTHQRETLSERSIRPPLIIQPDLDRLYTVHSLLGGEKSNQTKKKKKKNAGDFKCTMPPACNPTRPQHTLQMFADHCGPRQTKPWETINQGLLQPQGELYPIQTIFNHRSRDQLLEFRTSFHETISSEFLVQGNFKYTQFSREPWYWRDSNSQPLVPRASAVSIELTWLLEPNVNVNYGENASRESELGVCVYKH